MFEHRTKPLLSPMRFALRISRHFVAALAVVLGSLWIGVLGYHEFEGMDTTDAFLNAAMILSGMGPVQPLQTEAGKLFAGCYALYSGVHCRGRHAGGAVPAPAAAPLSFGPSQRRKPGLTGLRLTVRPEQAGLSHIVETGTTATASRAARPRPKRRAKLEIGSIVSHTAGSPGWVNIKCKPRVSFRRETTPQPSAGTPYDSTEAP